MDARIVCTAILTASLAGLGASHRTANFIVTASTAELARAVGDSAERYRRDLAIQWLGHELHRWPEPCPVSVHAGRNLGAGGETSFAFNNGQPFGWRMRIQGSGQRILDSVLPHEITHTIFATHFGRPLPRWADEGACTTVEHVSERQKQHDFLIRFLTTGRGISFRRMFAMREYPRDILPLYAQGYSLARYLIAQGGRQKFIQYVGDGMRTNDWVAATRKHYRFNDLYDLQVRWNDWVRHGSSPTEAQAMLAARVGGSGGLPQQRSQPVVRAQNEQERRILGLPLIGRRGNRTAADVTPVTWANNRAPARAVGPDTRAQRRDSQGSWYVSQRNRATRR